MYVWKVKLEQLRPRSTISQRSILANGRPNNRNGLFQFKQIQETVDSEPAEASEGASETRRFSSPFLPTRTTAVISSANIWQRTIYVVLPSCLHPEHRVQLIPMHVRHIPMKYPLYDGSAWSHRLFLQRIETAQWMCLRQYRL